jgi:CBS-domain-containing membrane protein
MKEPTAKDIMNTEVKSIRADRTINELANFFTEEMISGAPVVDEQENLVGVVSVTDIVRDNVRRYLVEKEDQESDFYLHGWENQLNNDDLQNLHVEAEEGLTVRDIMTPIIFKVKESTPITEMADMMINGRIHRLLVTRDEKLLGIVSTLDMLRILRICMEEKN